MERPSCHSAKRHCASLVPLPGVEPGDILTLLLRELPLPIWPQGHLFGASSRIRTCGFTVLQTVALDHSAIDAYCLAPVEGIEPPLTVLETAVMPLYHTGKKLVLPLGFEPRSSPHLEASPGYKPGALTVKLWEQNLERVARIELANQLWQSCRLPLHHTRKIGTP
jgi:hypothetical protein